MPQEFACPDCVIQRMVSPKVGGREDNIRIGRIALREPVKPGVRRDADGGRAVLRADAFEKNFRGPTTAAPDFRRTRSMADRTTARGALEKFFGLEGEGKVHGGDQ